MTSLSRQPYHTITPTDQNENSLIQHPINQPKDNLFNIIPLQQNHGAPRIFGRELTNHIEHNYFDKSKLINGKNAIHQFSFVRNGIPTHKISLSIGSVNTIDKIPGEARTEKKPMSLVSIKASTTDDNEDEQCDKENYFNPQYVAQYIKDIITHMRATEEKTLASSTYISKLQKDINEKMRGVLIDWLVDVHLKFKLRPETIFLAVNIIDRYLSMVDIPRKKLQLVGVSSMFIACKYEEIYPPELKEFEYITDKAYTKNEILEMEGKILCTLNFNLVTVSSYRFLERYGKVSNLDDKGMNLARYIIELALIEYKMLKYLPSNIACSAIYLVNKINKKEGWPETLAKSCKYTDNQIKICAKDLCVILQNANKSNLQAVKKKFSHVNYNEVGKIQLEKMQQLDVYY